MCFSALTFQCTFYYILHVRPGNSLIYIYVINTISGIQFWKITARQIFSNFNFNFFFRCSLILLNKAKRTSALTSEWEVQNVFIGFFSILNIDISDRIKYIEERRQTTMLNDLLIFFLKKGRDIKRLIRCRVSTDTR